MLSTGVQSSVLLLSMPPEVFQAVVLALNQRWCVDVHMSFKAHPSTGGRCCLRSPEGA